MKKQRNCQNLRHSSQPAPLSVPNNISNYSGGSSKMDVKPFYPKTERQRDFWGSMNSNVVSIAYGCAGTGKTLLALWYGLEMVSEGLVDKIMYVRSDVGMEHQRGRGSGALKGSYAEKFSPLLSPLLDNLNLAMRSKGSAEYLLNKGIVEGSFLEDVRGRSFNQTFVIVDEVQNVTRDQVKTCLTRVGEDSKMVLIGDTQQGDNPVIRQNCGLSDAVRRLHGIKDVGITQFGINDIVRNPLIKEILSRYESPNPAPHLSLAA